MAKSDAIHPPSRTQVDLPARLQPILNYLILYGMANNRAGAAEAMKYVLEKGADANAGAPNGVGRNLHRL